MGFAVGEEGEFLDGGVFELGDEVLVFGMVFVFDLTGVDVNGRALEEDLFFVFEPVKKEVLDGLGRVGLVWRFEKVRNNLWIRLRLSGGRLIVMGIVGC